MMPLLLVAAGALFALLYLFFCGYVKRLYLCYCVPAIWRQDEALGVMISKKRRICLRIIALLPALLCCNVLSIAGIGLLHLAALGAALHGLYLLLRAHVPVRIRRIHFSGVLPLALALVWMLCGYINLHHVRPVHYTVTTEKQLPEGGVTLALISDVHYGVSLTGEAFQQVCDEISALHTDAVLLCGDIADNDTPKGGVEEVMGMLGAVQSRMGTYFTYGNHDRPYAMGNSRYTPQDLLAATEAGGVTLLRDEGVPLCEGVMLYGREDASRPRADAESLLADAGDGQYVIVMDHQPTDYEALSRSSCDLVLSGHTHGGQLFPLSLIMRLFHINDAVYGQTALPGGAQAIVSSGLAGWRFPIKTNAPAEYVIITIRNP